MELGVLFYVTVVCLFSAWCIVLGLVIAIDKFTKYTVVGTAFYAVMTIPLWVYVFLFALFNCIITGVKDMAAMLCDDLKHEFQGFRNTMQRNNDSKFFAIITKDKYVANRIKQQKEDVNRVLGRLEK